ncbi:MAG: bile acid:sodium symporter family protein [Cytophagales bacterium]|nr:bile acid:sodium symporter family protein [Cytophagales bacterium]
MILFQRSGLWIAIISVIGLVFSVPLDALDLAKFFTVIGIVSFAIGVGSLTALKSYSYTVWIIAAIVCGMVYPSTFLYVGEFDLRNKWLILIVIQLVMFGMGTQMSLKDFSGIGKMGKGVLVGVVCQFTIMPLAGYGLTKVFSFDPEVAAGIILIGSCSSGLASNVMVFLAKANLPLSVTLTAVATLLAPLMTPLLMTLLAGTYVEIDFLSMCFQIIQIVIVPIGAALLAEALRTYSSVFNRRVHICALVAFFWLIVLFFGGWKYLGSSFLSLSLQLFEMLNFLAGAILFGVIFYHLSNSQPKLSGIMPRISMCGIVYFTLVTTAASQENILQIGILLFLVAVIQNTLGYSLDYTLSRMLKLNKNDARTIALEVGLQNGGMAAGLAGVMGKLATVGLAAAIFSPWMNISGSILANYWRKKD